MLGYNIDSFYNSEGAKLKLGELAATRRIAVRVRNADGIAYLADANVCLNKVFDAWYSNGSQVDDFKVTESSNGQKNWRLCIRENEEDDVWTECIFQLQALTQAADVIGLDSNTFEDTLLKVPAIAKWFEEHLLDATLINNVVSTRPIGNVFGVGNRLFTSRQNAPTEQDNPFHPGLDLLGFLASMKGESYIHSPENMVHYFTRIYDNRTMNFDYAPFIPGGFRVGDIVELQMTFVAILYGVNKVKVTSRLQAVTLLNNMFSKEAHVVRTKAMERGVTSTLIRRRVRYSQADIDEECKHKKNRENSPHIDNHDMA
ncbi:hypothetical protein C8R45DRAFT_931026 [Mycena sanguinolenta]|nr:hypothetical protein C8R45DRAFT_931026 [Mycena sanguinolenta]